MQNHPPRKPRPRKPQPEPDDFPADPRALSLSERQAWAERLRRDNEDWLRRLEQLAEVRLSRDFPAFLLATPPFTRLAGWLGAASSRGDLGTGIAEELDRFVDAYRDYLRSNHGEDVFAPIARRTC